MTGFEKGLGGLCPEDKIRLDAFSEDENAIG